MKNLNDYINECGSEPIAPTGATPGNTLGMGNPMPPGEGEYGSEPITSIVKRKKKKKKIDESILDDEDILMDKPEQLIKIAKWLTDASVNSNQDTLSIFVKELNLNPDGTFDLPEYSKFGWKNYEFNIYKELPEYIRFNNIGSRKIIFNIFKKGEFTCNGFPKSILTSIKIFGNCDIKVPYCTKLSIPNDVFTDLDTLNIEGKLLEDVYLNPVGSPMIIEVNSSNTRLRNNSEVRVHNIPKGVSLLGIPNYTKEWLLKEWNVLSWSTGLIKYR